MELRDLAFYPIGALTVFAAVVVAFSRDVLRAAYALMAMLLACAGLFLLLAAPFVALVQLTVYIGGTAALILTTARATLPSGAAPPSSWLRWGPALALAGTTGGALAYVAMGTDWLAPAGTRAAATDTALVEHGVSWTLAAVALLAALVGAAALARKEVRSE